MSGRAFDLVVFDWDGTLMDSAGRIVACLRSAIADLGWEPRPNEVLRDIIGLSLTDACNRLYPGAPPGAGERLLAAYRHYYFSSLHEPERPFPGAEAVLAELTERGFLLAIATGKGRAGLDRALRESGLRRYFDASRCADESAPKPHPRMLLDLMEEFAMPPARTLMVGDTEYDLSMARDAGVAAVAAAYGAHAPERLLAYRPLACLHSIAELPALLARLR
ncbi:MAG TPA: HAD-IA family hydrolase [Candidatus Competibacteraceae bacterium]|nr:HAD-IA family hydrolase [Candidatus Competibacteraceae bacterium]